MMILVSAVVNMVTGVRVLVLAAVAIGLLVQIKHFEIVFRKCWPAESEYSLVLIAKEVDRRASSDHAE
jgi:hypothetical protein